MFSDSELWNLVDQAGVRVMANGLQVVIRAEWTDRTNQQPQGLDYAIILQDEHGDRILGFDNSHAYDGASENDPWDHEHKVGRTGQHFRYNFVSASQLITDFFERLDTYCLSKGISSDFSQEDDL
jgi:hypothetical protein